MSFFYFPLSKAHLARGTVVVIDVLRAFTTAAYAFEAGASQIFPVSTVEDAFQLKNHLPKALVMGEVGGHRPPGFDFGNSPAMINQQNLTGKHLIQRTSAGTQGIVRAIQANRLFATSFVVASATAKVLQQIQPETISFIITGESRARDGEEDRACGEYIQQMIQGHHPDPAAYISRVMTSTVGLAFNDGYHPTISQKDMDLCLAVNRFHFTLNIRSQGSHLVMEKG